MLPILAQEKSKTCALACLRMLLAAHGSAVQEQELEEQARIEVRGTPIDELERLARLRGLQASIETTTPEDLAQLIAEGHHAIAYIDRAIFDLTPKQRTTHRLVDSIIHCVIPVAVTDRAVICHDPLISDRTRRRSLRLWKIAHGRLGYPSVVCRGPETP